MSLRAASLRIALTVAGLAGCGSSLSSPDGGTGASGASGTGAGGSASGGRAGAGGTGGSVGGSGGSVAGAGGTGGSVAGAGGSVAGAGGGGGGPADGGVVPPEYRAQLDAAASLWAAGKSSCTTYSYDRQWISPWTGFIASTEVEIRNDSPTRRRWRTGSLTADGGGDWTVAWDETGSEIGLHKTDYRQFPASTVEQLLAECQGILARDPADYFLTLELDPGRGIPRRCTYVPRNCADECEVGIRIATFTCSPLP